jgi:alpha-galactosidase
MGWTSELIYDCSTLTEESVKEAAHFMSVNAVNKAGYKYVILGDCWQNKQREANGTLLLDSARFPSGILELQ